MDVPGLADRETAGDARVSGPGVLDTGGPFVAPHPADDFGRGLDDAAGSGQFADGLGVGGAHQPDPAIGGRGDPAPLVIVAAQSLPGLRRDLDTDAEGPAAFVQLPQRHPARHRRVVITRQQDRPRLALAAGGGVRDKLRDGHGLGFGDRLLSRAFQDEIPGVRIRQGARTVQARAEARQQGAVAQADIGQAAAGSGHRAQPGGVPGVGGFQPARFQPVQERRAVGRGSGWCGDGEGDHGLGDVGVVGGSTDRLGLDQLEQCHGQLGGRQAPQRHGGLIGPDRHPASPGSRAANGGCGRL